MKLVSVFLATISLICGCAAAKYSEISLMHSINTPLNKMQNRKDFYGDAHENEPISKDSAPLFTWEQTEDNGQEKIKRMIIYTAQFVLSVYDCDISARKVVELAQNAGGYISSQTNETVVIRVPADRFKEITDELVKIGRVTRKKIEASDITEQYADFELRLSSKRKYLATLQELLSKAQDVKTMLEIQKEIGSVVEEIEAIEGKLRYLRDQVAFSTITVTFELATAYFNRTFRLPFEWIESLGIEHLIIVGGGAR